MNSSVVLIFFTVLMVIQVFADSDSEQEVEVTSHHTHHHRHRHRHPHHHSPAFSSDSQEFIAAYRATESPSSSEDNEDGGEGRSLNNLEERLESLESDVRHLCIEDEEDVERRIRYLGVQCKKCPKTEAPVCGSDNVTYYNRCYLQCRAAQVEQSYHRYEKITLKKFGPC